MDGQNGIELQAAMMRLIARALPSLSCSSRGPTPLRGAERDAARRGAERGGGARARGAARVVTMGIPKMFRWLTDQYPQILERTSVGLSEAVLDEEPVDNFFLDMNGIIHQCTHANEQELAVLDERAMFARSSRSPTSCTSRCARAACSTSRSTASRRARR